MLRNRELRISERFGITEQLESFKADLLKIEGVTSVEYDLDGFLDNMHQLILVFGYDIPCHAVDYFPRARKMLHDVVDAGKKYRLSPTYDDVEDYGAHFYIVFHCPWEVKAAK